jgi:hypothetical protein
MPIVEISFKSIRGFLLHRDGFHIDEFMKAKHGEFPAIAGLFDAAKRKPGIGSYEIVDKT